MDSLSTQYAHMAITQALGEPHSGFGGPRPGAMHVSRRCASPRPHLAPPVAPEDTLALAMLAAPAVVRASNQQVLTALATSGGGPAAELAGRKKALVYRTGYLQPAQRQNFVRNLGIPVDAWATWWREIMPKGLTPLAPIEPVDVARAMLARTGVFYGRVAWTAERYQELSLLIGDSFVPPEPQRLLVSRALKMQWCAVHELLQGYFHADLDVMSAEERSAVIDAIRTPASTYRSLLGQEP